MKAKHILFFLAHQYGHINPSLGMAIELVRRGHNVSYVISESFAPVIKGIGAHPIILDLLDNRDQAITNGFRENDHLQYQPAEKMAESDAAVYAKTRQSLLQLEKLYNDGKPDFLIYDNVLDAGGSDFARKFRIPNALLRSQFIAGSLEDQFVSDEVVLVTVPNFFQGFNDQSAIPSRYKFVGFSPEGRTLGTERWNFLTGDSPRVLISPTTGIFRQVRFCERMIEIFRNCGWTVILSISGSRDVYSLIDPVTFAEFKTGLRINRLSANFDILPNVHLYVGQGGQGSALESIYHRVPQIVVPASPYHNLVGERVQALGLGACLPFSELTADGLIQKATFLIADKETHGRLEAASISMHENHSDGDAADFIESQLAKDV